MQLKQFYDIATKVSSRKNATTFGDLPDCTLFSERKVLANKLQIMAVVFSVPRHYENQLCFLTFEISSTNEIHPFPNK